MAEPLSEQIIEAVKTALAAIVSDDGTTYWYTPEVERIVGAENLMLNEGKETLYYLIPDHEEHVEGATGEITKTIFLDAFLARQFRQTDVPFEQEEPIRWTVQNRLLADFCRAIYADVSLGGLVENAEIPNADLSSDATFVSGWAIVILKLKISFSEPYV